jgi:hypothetical protein
MINGTNQLEPANLNVSLTYPDGDANEAASLVITCRKSNLIVAKIEMTAEDLVNFHAGRNVGALEGQTRVLNQRGRSFLNSDRHLVTVTLPDAVSVFGEDDGRNVYAWSADVARTYGAADVRVVRRRGGYAVSLIFFLSGAADERAYLEGVSKLMTDDANRYGADAVAKRDAR